MAIETICAGRDDPGFVALTRRFDEELAEKYGADMMRSYTPHNALDGILHAVVVRCDGQPAACGGIRRFSADTAELKRMYVCPERRGCGLGGMVYRRLEALALSDGFSRIVLETGADMTAALALYRKCGFTRISSYGPYAGDPHCVCMEKRLEVRERVTAIEVKTATEADAALIEALAKEIWTQHYQSIISREQIAFMLETFQSVDAISADMRGGAVYDIALFDGEPCGYSAAAPDDTGLFLSKLYVRQSRRGRGIARAMADRIDARARDIDARRVWLKCNRRNTDSLAAYERLGFHIAYPCVTRIGAFVMDDYVLEKTL